MIVCTVMPSPQVTRFFLPHPGCGCAAPEGHHAPPPSPPRGWGAPLALGRRSRQVKRTSYQVPTHLSDYLVRGKDCIRLTPATGGSGAEMTQVGVGVHQLAEERQALTLLRANIAGGKLQFLSNRLATETIHNGEV